MSYAWADEPYSNNYRGDFNTIQECIADAKDMGRKAETAIWIGRVEETDIRLVNLAIILDDLHNAVCDEVGELADDWYIENEEAYKKCEEDINDLVVKFIEENGMKPTFSKVTDIKPYFVK